MKKIQRAFLLAGVFWFSGILSANAFDVIDEKVSYADSKFFTYSTGLGFTGFHLGDSIDSSAGFAVRVGVGHHLNQYIQAEILYQFAILSLTSPDPVSPGQTLNTGAFMNQEMFRFVFSYPAVMLQPFFSIGIGGYNLFGVDRATDLKFGSDWMIPFGAGLRAYFFENRMSLDAEFGYQLLLGENQSQTTLGLLGVNEIAFNTYSTMFSLTFHLW